MYYGAVILGMYVMKTWQLLALDFSFLFRRAAKELSKLSKCHLNMCDVHVVIPTHNLRLRDF